MLIDSRNPRSKTRRGRPVAARQHVRLGGSRGRLKIVKKPHQETSGSFEEFQKKVVVKHRNELDALYDLKPVVDKALRIITKLAANSFGAVQLLVWHGYGNDAFNVAQSIFEAAVNAAYLRDHPDKARDYLDYSIVLEKRQRNHLIFKLLKFRSLFASEIPAPQRFERIAARKLGRLTLTCREIEEHRCISRPRHL